MISYIKCIKCKFCYYYSRDIIRNSPLKVAFFMQIYLKDIILSRVVRL